MTESMSLLTDPVWPPQQRVDELPTHAAVLGELAAQWQQMMWTLQRVEQEIVSSQNLAHAIENLSKTRSDVTGSRLRLKDGERLYPKSWSGSTPLGGLRERSLHGWDMSISSTRRGN